MMLLVFLLVIFHKVPINSIPTTIIYTTFDILLKWGELLGQTLKQSKDF